MITITPRAATVLKNKLLRSCLETGIGFRLLPEKSEQGGTALIIKLDKVRGGDRTIEIDGLKVFIDTTAASLVGGKQLDYTGGTRGEFYLKAFTEDEADIVENKK